MASTRDLGSQLTAIYIGQFKDPLIMLLLASAIISVVLGQY
eukprot:CAMPEP_0119539168 /NCGR_PEP_ID=MMETSP1344-20130328/51405_1 /TAXON_ID=236787 /ORGANISM="Florenciella parvula, Strain CCMP2471" /LENGTH=40 /DNA_ID= /DNA_START= /DNA_END= /DNA_ORIENTATION=